MRTRMALVTLLGLLACGPHAPETPAPSSGAGAPPSTASTSLAPSASIASAGPAPVTEPDARALLDAWVAAQNAGTMPAYESLYASRFDGIRRSGPRVRRFDRAGWMQDRRAMFAHPMQVGVRDVVVTLSPTGATLRFTQSFTEGTYHDEGTKEMTLVREPTGLRIAREEMLSSAIGARAAAGTQGPEAGAAMPIVSAGAQRWAVLAAVPEGADWHAGAPELVVRDAVVVTRAAVRPGAVPAPLAALAHQTVSLGDAGGSHCAAHLGDLVVLSRVDVHFGVEQAWDGQQPDGSRGPPATNARIAADAWGEGMLLAAALDDAADCPSATYARLASAPADRAFARTDADAALATRVRAAFRALAGWTSLEATFHDPESHADGETPPASAHWDETDGAAPAVALWQLPGAGRRFAVIGASTASGGCADFSGAMWAVFEVDAQGALTPLTDASDPGYFVPVGAVDVDGDGAPEWIVPEGIVGRASGGLGLVEDISPAMHDCYC